MKSFRSVWAVGAVALIGVVAGARGELAGWVQNIAGTSPLDAVFFKAVTVGIAMVSARRPPAETRPALAKLITASPNDAALFSLRALEAEQQLDFAAAEADWIRHAQLAADKAAGQIALADFYHRQSQSGKELAALHAAATAPAAESQRLRPAPEQQSWKTFERAIALVDDHLLGYDAARTQFRSWVEKYPAEPAVYSRFIDYAVARKQFADAEQAARDYVSKFPNDAISPVRAQAAIEAARGSTQAALALYDRSFRALWPPELVKSYFELLAKTGSLRRYLQDARRSLESNSGGVNAAARIFYYWQRQGNLASAQHALMEYEARKQAAKSVWTADELTTLAALYESGNNPDRAARCYYALYSLPGGTPADAERALAGLTNLLFVSAGQNIRFGSADLAYYRDIAQADPHPGYLNGVLSLILNTTGPQWKYSEENQQAQPYFHRAQASELAALFDTRFPNSTERPRLHTLCLNAYAIHGDNQAVIQEGTKFRAAFPDSSYRTEVATLMADAYARLKQVPAEFAMYDELLAELGKRAGGVPLGEHAVPLAPVRAGEPQETPVADQPHPRSPEYARILDRYIARLAGFKRIPDALALYRREIDRNPNDPGLYQRFAAFLEQNRLGADVEATYKRAIAQFPDTSWRHKLARWYLRQKQSTQFSALTREVTGKFSGSELEAYFKDAVPRGGTLAPALYLQLNLYAHQRFPHNLAFTRNLLAAYTTRGTADASAYDGLLRANWYYADDLRLQFFRELSSRKTLDAELAALGAITTPEQVNANPAAARMLADGEAWKAHYESAAPVYRMIAASYPVASPTTERAVALYRSLATIDPQQADVAAGLQANLVRYLPGNSAALTYAGEIWADRERFDRARPLWNAIAASTPGRAEGYLESATVFWDYYQFDDALNQIDQGRRQLGDPALHAYQAGAIYENKRQYDRALAEYATAAIRQSNDLAERRLVRLARRPALRDSVERLTANLAAGPDVTVRAIALRTAVLDNQGRRAELEQFLVASASRASSPDVIEQIENQGRISGFVQVQESAMLRRVEITTDPVDQARYRLALAHLYQDQGRTEDAARVLDALLQAHPNTLGVVRAAADFYWRTGQSRRAVTILTDAANRAQSPYQGAFRLEAARKATESGDTASARQALALLLKDEPYRAEYLSAMAETYAHSGDDRGLRAFYQSTIESLRAASLSPAEKTAQTAAMRRALIPVLTRVRDFSAALDQYIEILNRYPEDEQLARDASAYAGVHQLGGKLAGYYAKAAADSPRDYRPSMLLGRVYVGLERFPEAVDAYAKATAIRPDRVDLWTAQAEIAERLLRFADAERNYARVFELTYHNAYWMERVAAVRARLGQKDAAIAALRTAHIENRPERAENYFAVASKLDAWGYIDDARKFADEGAEVAGPELTTAQNESAAVYGRVLGRARAYEAAYQRLIANGTEPNAAPALSYGMNALGQAVRDYYTPEEKAAFAAYLEQQHKPGLRAQFDAVAAAGLEDVTVRWLAATVRANPGDSGAVTMLADRQRARMRSGELGAQLEGLWKAAPAQVEGRDMLLARAIDAYRDAGDTTSELRAIRLKKERGGLDPQMSRRFCQLLALRPAALATVAGSDPSGDVRDMAANCAIENTRATDALAAVAARGKGLPPVWTSAYTGLVGLYFSVTTPQVRDAFLEALGSPVIADRIGKPLDRDRQLAGQPWFYYGARYGEYLDLEHQPNGTDYVPAVLEAAPGNPNAYYDLANYYRESGASERALVEYAHALELDPVRGSAHDWTAELLWAAGKHDDALNEWRMALDALNQQQNRHAAPPAFWDDLKTTLTHIGQHDILPALQPDADRVLKTYLKRNGTYQFEPVLEGILQAAGDPAKGVAWLEELSRSAGDPSQVLAWAVRHESVPEAQRDQIYQKLIDIQQRKLASSFGEVREGVEAMLRTWQFDWLQSLVRRRETARAQALLNTIPDKARRERQGDSVRLELHVAAQAGAIPALLERYAADRQGPPVEALRNAASELRKQGENQGARTVLDFVYSRELEAHRYDAANFLGLAEIRLEQNQAPAAVNLLQRMTMLSGEPFETQMSAAALLERFSKTAEALPFVEQRVKAVPWDVAAGERLAEARKSAQELAAVANDKFAPYASRGDAAIALRHAGGTTTASGSAELDLLASAGPLTGQAVNKPYWYPARIEAASATKDAAAKIRILLGAMAVRSDQPGPRLDLFRAAMEQKRYALAIASMPAQPENSIENLPEGGLFPEWMASSFLQGAPYGIPDRAFIAAGLGESYQRLNEPARSAYFYRLSLDLDRSAAARSVVGPKLEVVTQAVALRKTNAERRPVVSSNLEQPHAVRPRVTVVARRGR